MAIDPSFSPWPSSSIWTRSTRSLSLMPADVHGRHYVRAVSQIIGCDIHPLNNVRVLKHVRTQFGADDAATKTWYRHWIAEGLGGLETYVTSAGFPVASAMAIPSRWPTFVSCRRFSMLNV